MVFSALLVFGLLILLDLAVAPDDAKIVLWAFVTLFLLSSAMGRLVAVIGMMSDSWARAFPILLRPFFWISGIFYTAIELPKSILASLWYNPLFHVTEAVRSGYFASYNSPIGLTVYPVVCAAVMFLLSLALEPQITRQGRERFRL